MTDHDNHDDGAAEAERALLGLGSELAWGAAVTAVNCVTEGVAAGARYGIWTEWADKWATVSP